MTSSTKAPRVVTEIEGPVARVWLNRPDQLNGLDLDMMNQLTAAAKSKKNLPPPQASSSVPKSTNMKA